MKRIIALLLAFTLEMVLLGCNAQIPSHVEHGTESVQYSFDLSQFPTDTDCMGYGKIVEITDGKLLIIPGSEQAKNEYGEVVWLICDEAEAYSLGQVVTYTFRDVKAPDKEGEPLKIITLTVYME